MHLQISKWGNSLAVRLPSAVVKKLHIADGDSVELTLNNQGELMLTPAKVFDKGAFMQSLNALNQKQPKTRPVITVMHDSERY